MRTDPPGSDYAPMHFYGFLRTASRHDIGGLCVEGRPRFPAARHVMSRIEWDWVSEDDDAIAREQLPPLREAGILELVEGTVDLVAGIRLIPAPGHTPDQLAVEIGPRGARSTSPMSWWTSFTWSTRNG